MPNPGSKPTWTIACTSLMWTPNQLTKCCCQNEKPRKHKWLVAGHLHIDVEGNKILPWLFQMSLRLRYICTSQGNSIGQSSSAHVQHSLRPSARSPGERSPHLRLASVRSNSEHYLLHLPYEAIRRTGSARHTWWNSGPGVVIHPDRVSILMEQARPV